VNFHDAIEKLDKEVVEEKVTKEKAVELIKATRKPILLKNVSGCMIAANICTRENIKALYGLGRKQLMQRMLSAIENPIEPKIVSDNVFKKLDTDLTKLPVLKHYKEEPGPYINSGVFFIEDPKHGRNLSYHRTLVLGKDKASVRVCYRHMWDSYQDSKENL